MSELQPGGIQAPEQLRPPQPSPILRSYVETIPIGMPRHDLTALDVGCGRGRNSVYMAARGFTVVGVDTDPDELRMATILRDSMSISEFRCQFVEADVRDMPQFDNEPFNLVTANEVLHQLPKADQYELLRDMQLRTKRIGLNAVSGYLLSEGVRDERNLRQMLNPGELKRFYESNGWRMRIYREGKPDIQQVNGKELVATKVQMVAVTPGNHRPRVSETAKEQTSSQHVA